MEEWRMEWCNAGKEIYDETGLCIEVLITGPWTGPTYSAVLWVFYLLCSIGFTLEA